MDYSHTSQKVAEAGYVLAKSLHAEVILLHVIAEPIYYSSTEYSSIMGFTGYMDPTEPQLTHNGLITASQQFLEKAKSHLGDNTIKIKVGEGDFAETILKTAKELHVDMIVLGTHSRRWLDEIIMGSVTEKVLHQSTLPLFIIPTKQKK